MRWSLILIACFCLLGCASLKSTFDDYERCKNDAACLAEVQQIKEVTGEATEKMASAAGLDFPRLDLPSLLGWAISGVAGFGAGVIKGRKLKAKGAA